MSRRLPDAVIADPAEVAARVLRMVCEHEVMAIDGTVVPLNADSVCVHGDSPSAVAMARAVRAAWSRKALRYARSQATQPHRPRGIKAVATCDS